MAISTKMYFSTVKAVFVVLYAACALGQQLHIQQAPGYVLMQAGDAGGKPPTLQASSLHDVLTAPLGLGGQQSSVLRTASVLRRPKASVLVTVVTPPGHSLPLNSLAQYPVDWDTPFVDTGLMMNKVQEKFFDKKPLTFDFSNFNKLFDIQTSSSVFAGLPSSMAAAIDRLSDPDSFLSRKPADSQPHSLNTSLPGNAELAAELQLMEDVVAKLTSRGSAASSRAPELLAFTVTGLGAAGAEGQASQAADTVVSQLNKLTSALTRHYGGHVVVAVATAPESLGRPLVRKARSLMGVVANDDPAFSKLNLEIDYHPDFPVTFNIVLWLMLILLITVFMVAYGIWNMNPNLESILYRVPQDEAKKNN